MNKQTILVIDDERSIQKLLQITLESNQYKVIVAHTGHEGVLLAANQNPDAILLDLGLPDASGHDILQQLREWFQKGIIILSVQNSEEDIVKALDNGASDYLTKPFRSAELLARIRNVIRKNSEATSSAVIEFGNIEVNLSNHSIKKNGELMHLTSTEYQLLTLLIKNEGCVLTHDFLLKEIWGLNYQNESQYLRVYIGNLRKKLESDPTKPVHIITESRVGYRFML
ncbi:MAG: hypothetical protein RLZZ77_326 [Bacteroidota bacterium]|jgi:two-component system KDP operon response regulator KdpE